MAFRRANIIRLEGDPTATTSHQVVTSNSPFFPDPSSLVPPTQTSDAESANAQALSKSILEWIFFVVALVLIGSILSARSWQLRRTNRSFKEFFSFSRHSQNNTGRPQYVPRTTGLHAVDHPFTPVSLTNPVLYPSLHALPIVYHGNQRRTRAMDTDEGGRRAGNPEDGDPDQKDLLPAYDNVGGPPKYMELEMDAARTRLRLGLAGMVRGEQHVLVEDVTGQEQNTPTQTAGARESNSPYSSPPYHMASVSTPRHPDLAPDTATGDNPVANQ